jgi:hypothetical protein
MEWAPHVIRQGETLAQLAWRAGVDMDTIWTYEKNADLAKRRKNPQALLPTDVIYLPTTPPKTKTYTLNTGQTNTFVASVPMVSIVVKLPEFSGASYTALVDDDPIPSGSVDGDGTLSLSVPIDAERVSLTFDSPVGALDLVVGHLDPADSPSGRHQRLENLGLPVPHPKDDPDGHALRRAIAIFQLAKGLEPTGEFDAATQTALETEHGS